jgi:hypothetical protein
VELSVRHPSPPNTYSYVQEETPGSTRKFVENHLLLTCITNQILALSMYNTPVEHGWAGESFLGQQKKSSSSPQAAGIA